MSHYNSIIATSQKDIDFNQHVQSDFAQKSKVYASSVNQYEKVKDDAELLQ